MSPPALSCYRMACFGPARLSVWLAVQLSSWGLGVPEVSPPALVTLPACQRGGGAMRGLSISWACQVPCWVRCIELRDTYFACQFARALYLRSKEPVCLSVCLSVCCVHIGVRRQVPCTGHAMERARCMGLSVWHGCQHGWHEWHGHSGSACFLAGLIIQLDKHASLDQGFACGSQIGSTCPIEPAKLAQLHPIPVSDGWGIHTRTLTPTTFRLLNRL
jgi:hypothetical protein